MTTYRKTRRDLEDTIQIQRQLIGILSVAFCISMIALLAALSQLHPAEHNTDRPDIFRTEISE